MKETPDLSVIIPTLDESESLPTLLAHLKAQRNISLQIIVADGGSQDGTVSIAQAAGAELVQSAPGRAMQMNAAAPKSRAAHLLFLHSDSELDDSDLLAQALQTIKAQNVSEVAGHFPLKFSRSCSGHDLAYRYMEEKTAFNRPYVINGDQGLLISKQFFELLGGFDQSLPFFEDQRMAESIRQRGYWITLPGTLGTSARRFEHEGLHDRYWLMGLMMGMHYAGVDEFFARGRGIYEVQSKSEPLQLLPYLRLVDDVMKAMPRVRRRHTWLRIGCFTRENSWLMFYFLDVCLRPAIGEQRYPMLSFYDRVLFPATNWSIFDGLAAFKICVAVRLILRPWAWLKATRIESE